MWDALDIGSAPIQVLEPGCGTGNFMAGIPENIKANVSGVELDPISARIAAALNPDATILNADLADCTIHPGFDLTIGNVPYSGDISLDYRTTDGGTSRLPLHDYFIERSVDALRPGGVAMLLTSRYTLDKRSETMRADLARKAELVGAVRLPSSTFARQAGTEAVTDVLVLRRRERTLDRTPDEAWIHSNPVAVPGYQDVTVNVNQAVANDMTAHAVGDIRPVIGRFGGDFDVVFQGDAEQVGERLQELLSTQITHGPALSLGEAEPAGRAEITVRPDHVAPFEYSVDQRGVVWYGDGTTVTEIAHGQGDEARRLRGMIRLRDLARELQRLELDPARVDDPDVEAKRAELDRAYDRFTSEFGRLCDRANQRAYSGEESGCHLVMALEETDEKGRFAGKAKCLSQRTISPVPPMPDHADSLDDALDISLDRAGGVDLELIARLADTTVEEAETGLGDRIIRDPDTGEVMPAEDYLAGDVGTKLDHVTAMAEHLRRRAAREAMTEFAASTYATSEDMPAIEQAREWIDTAGTDVWRSLTDPYAAESYRDPTPVIERINDGRHGWTMGWNRNPELVLALVWRAVEELPERHSRVTLERSDTGERKPWHAPAWHRSHGTSPLWDALCWTWRDGDAPQHYAPILADRRMPVRDLALFVHKIAHTDRLETADKTAILSNLFESYSAHDKHGSTIWTDTTIGAMARRLMPGTDDPTRLAERLATDMSVSEWIWGIARDLPDLRQGAAHDAYGAPPRAIDARPDDYQAFRARREEQLGQWREQPEHAEAARADQTDAERLEHVADLLERVQPTPLETEQIKAPLGAPWIPARDVHDFMMETFNVRGHGLTPGKLSQYSVDWIPQLGQWRVGYSGGGDIDYKAARTYGTEDRNPFQLLEACLDNAQITVTKDSPTETTASGKPKRVKDQKATMAAIEKANAIRDAWNQWVFKDHDVTEVTQGGNAMGHYLEARLTDGRAVQIDFHDNPAWKDTDRLAGRIEVSYANRPQAEWQYDDNDMADREHTVIDPADPAAGKTLAKAVEGWERAGGLHTARAAGTSHLAANQPPEEYAYRWRKPGDPDRHIAYLSTAFDRDQAMKARENAGYVVTKVDEDPAVLYEQHRKASCMRASHILERYESPDQDAVRILHGIVGEVNAHDPENDIATYLAYPSDKAVQIAGDGLTSADIAEKREMGGWDPRKDPLMRINAQGDWTGITQQQADQIVWDNRDEILTRASYDSELSTWTLHQLDQLKEPQPAQSLDRDRPEPDHKAPAQADSTTKRHGPRL